MKHELQAKGVQFSEGLTEAELCEIEALYDIKFPRSLRGLYSQGVPFTATNNRFPCWRDYSEPNIAKIKQLLKAPLDWLLRDVERGFWISQWGERPKTAGEITGRFTEIAMKAPRLIPVYSHRYVPRLEGVDDPPVISTVGRDTIYYGGNLREYLRHEFISGFISGGHFTVNCAYIPFWSDVIGNK